MRANRHLVIPLEPITLENESVAGNGPLLIVGLKDRRTASRLNVGKNGNGLPFWIESFASMTCNKFIFGELN